MHRFSKLVIKILLVFSLLLIGAGPLDSLAQSACSGNTSTHETFQTQLGILLVNSNSTQASFTVTGPAIYQGTGYSWVEQAIPAGTYTITWNSVPGCLTPSPETKTTNANGSVAFAGNYQSTSNTTTPTPAPTASATPTPTPTPRGHYMTISSNPPSASVYINGSLMGIAPVKIKLPENVPIKIKCTLPGYSDYNYNYPTVGPLPVGVSSVNSDWACTLIKSSASSPTSTPAGKSPSVPAYQSGQQPNGTATPTILPVTPTPYVAPSPQPAQPKGFFSRIFSSVTSFFGKLMGRKNALPTPSPLSQENTYGNSSVGSSAGNLEGVWKVEQILMFDSTINDFRQTQAGGNYTEYKGDKVCINGVLGLNDTPQPCPRYDTFTLSGNQIIISTNIPYVIHWKVSGNTLELSLDPKVTPTTPNSPQKQKIILSRLNKNVPANSQPQNPSTSGTSQPSTQPTVNKIPNTPIVTAIKTPPPTPININDLEGIWFLDLDLSQGSLPYTNYIQFRGNAICPRGPMDNPFSLIACSQGPYDPNLYNGNFGTLPFTFSNNKVMFNFDGKQFVWTLSRNGSNLELVKNYDIDMKPIYKEDANETCAYDLSGKPTTCSKLQTTVGQTFFAKISSGKHALVKCDDNFVNLVKTKITGQYAATSIYAAESAVAACKTLQLYGHY